tara:strand:+ start:567 stop:1160 length:594 start_codon:yes stop_codon:yes gene_type:complete
MSPFNPDVDFISGLGYADYAGSGVVHLVGGSLALVGAVCVGPRIGRFEDKAGIQPHSVSLQFVGLLLLWTGWFGFNAGSTLCMFQCYESVGIVLVNTILSSNSAGITELILSRVLVGKLNLSLMMNGVLAGLVGITAGCAMVEPWAAIIIGIISAFVMTGTSRLLVKLRIDDPVVRSVENINYVSGRFSKLKCFSSF